MKGLGLVCLASMMGLAWSGVAAQATADDPAAAPEAVTSTEVGVGTDATPTTMTSSADQPAASDEVAIDGTASGDAVPEGVTSVGAAPVDAAPLGVVHDGMVPVGAVPEGTDPADADPATAGPDISPADAAPAVALAGGDPSLADPSPVGDSPLPPAYIQLPEGFVTVEQSGRDYTFISTAFTAGTTVSAQIDSMPVYLDPQVVDSSGMVTFHWSAPIDFEAGAHEVRLSTESLGASETFTVADASDSGSPTSDPGQSQSGTADPGTTGTTGTPVVEADVTPPQGSTTGTTGATVTNATTITTGGSVARASYLVVAGLLLCALGGTIMIVKRAGSHR